MLSGPGLHMGMKRVCCIGEAHAPTVSRPFCFSGLSGDASYYCKVTATAVGYVGLGTQSRPGCAASESRHCLVGGACYGHQYNPGSNGMASTVISSCPASKREYHSARYDPVARS